MSRFLRDLLGFMRVRKKYWLLPILVFLLMLGALMTITAGTPLAPFLYPLF